MEYKDLFNPKKYYDTRTIAGKLGYSIRTMYRLCNDETNPLPCIKIHGRIRVLGEDIIQYLKSNEVTEK